MSNLYVVGRVLGMSSFMHILVYSDIHVMHALRQSMGSVLMRDINVHMVVHTHIAVMCAVRHILIRVPL